MIKINEFVMIVQLNCSKFSNGPHTGKSVL